MARDLGTAAKLRVFALKLAPSSFTHSLSTLDLSLSVRDERVSVCLVDELTEEPEKIRT